MARNEGNPGPNGCLIVPEYASSLVHELSLGSDGFHYIRVLLNGEAIDFCPTGRGYNNKYCRYEDSRSLAYDVLVVKNFDEVCKGKPIPAKKGNDNSQI